jgi:hypothetical protein
LPTVAQEVESEAEVASLVERVSASELEELVALLKAVALLQVPVQPELVEQVVEAIEQAQVPEKGSVAVEFE